MRHGEQGFSLLETIAALVILALALTTLFDAYGSGIRAVSAGNRHAEARLLAQSLIASISEPATAGTRQGKQNGLTWRVAVAPADGEAANDSAQNGWLLFEVVATVRWAPGRRITLRSLRMGGKT